MSSFRRTIQMRDGTLAEALRTQCWDDCLSPVKFLLASLLLVSSLHVIAELMLLRMYRGYFFEEATIKSWPVTFSIAYCLLLSLVINALFYRKRRSTMIKGFLDGWIKTFQMFLCFLAGASIISSVRIVFDDLGSFLTNGGGQVSNLAEWLNYADIALLLFFLSWLLFRSLPHGLGQLHGTSPRRMLVVIVSLLSASVSYALFLT